MEQHQATPPEPQIGGSYTRHPETGELTRVSGTKPAGAPDEATDEPSPDTAEAAPQGDAEAPPTADGSQAAS